MTSHCSVLGSRCLVLKKFQDHTMTLLSGPEILGPHNDVGEMVRSWSGPETPGIETITAVRKDGPEVFGCLTTARSVFMFRKGPAFWEGKALTITLNVRNLCLPPPSVVRWPHWLLLDLLKHTPSQQAARLGSSSSTFCKMLILL